LGADGNTADATLPTLLLPGLQLVTAPAPRPEPSTVTLRGADPSVDHGDTFVACVDVERNGAVHDGVTTSIPLHITLVWTDPPASPLAATALVNNLDLEVLPPAGDRLLRGNNDEAAIPQAMDAVNNVEKVVVAFPAATLDFVTGARLAPPWSIVVRGTHVPLGPQAFSLAITAAGARLAPAGSCAAPLQPNAYSPAQVVPITGGGTSSPTVSVGTAVAVWVASVVVLGAGWYLTWRRRQVPSLGGIRGSAVHAAAAAAAVPLRSGRVTADERRPLL